MCSTHETDGSKICYNNEEESEILCCNKAKQKDTCNFCIFPRRSSLQFESLCSLPPMCVGIVLLGNIIRQSRRGRQKTGNGKFNELARAQSGSILVVFTFFRIREAICGVFDCYWPVVLWLSKVVLAAMLLLLMLAGWYPLGNFLLVIRVFDSDFFLVRTIVETLSASA